MGQRRRKPYENNRFYEIVDGILWFICPGGKRIKVREAQPYDYGEEDGQEEA